MGVPSRQGVKRLRGNRIEERVNGVRVRRLQARVSLKSKPGGIVLIDVVIDSNGLYLFMVVAGVGNASSVGAAISIRRISHCRCAAEPRGHPSTARGCAIGLLVE